MTAKRRRKNKKWLKWVGFLILVIVAGVVCYLVYDAYFRGPEEIDVDEMPTVPEVIITDEKVEEEIDEKEEIKPVTEKEEVKQYEGEDPNKGDGLTGNITSTSVRDGVLRIRVNINQYVTSGNCELTILKDGNNVYSATAEVMGMASTATCQGFDVPVAEIGGGLVKILININAGGKTGAISGEVQL